MPTWVNQGVDEYRKRIIGSVSFKVIEIPAIKRGKNPDLKRIADQEGKLLLAALPSNVLPIALDRLGKEYDTEMLAVQLQTWVDDAQDVAFLVGGPEGLSDQCLAECRLRLKLSTFTFSHTIVRVILAEQLYRAFSVTRGLPYHR
jgi:23S rRNA (pseudouridine1915-N3)-methyltransferase